MSQPTVFADLATAATAHLAAGQPPPNMQTGNWAPQASEPLAAVSRTLAAMVRDCSGAFDTAAAWQEALHPSWLALRSAERAFQQCAAGGGAGLQTPGPGIDELQRAATAIAAARDLLNSHYKPAPGGGLADNSEWAPAVRSLPVAAAILRQVADWSQQAGTIKVPAAPAAGQVLLAMRGAGRLRAAAAIIAGAQAGDTSALTLGIQLLRAVPVNQRPAWQPPGAGSELETICTSAAVAGELARYAARRTAASAQYSPHMSAAAVRETAVACTVVAHHCAVGLEILTGLPGAPVRLAAAAEAAGRAREAWLAAARTLAPFASDSPAAVMPEERGLAVEVLHARNLAQCTGQLVYADPNWTVRTPPGTTQSWRPPSELGASQERAAAVMSALHQAAYTLATLSGAGRQQLRTAIAAGRMLVQPHKLLPGQLRYEPGPLTRRYREQWARPSAPVAGRLLVAYDAVIANSDALLAAVGPAAAELGAPSSLLIDGRATAVRIGTSSHWGSGWDPARRPQASAGDLHATQSRRLAQLGLATRRYRDRDRQAER